jgi:prephenate dehydrogenase
MRTVAIAGVGLIGGSFALALRKAGFTGTILGVSSPATVESALRLGVIDGGAGLDEALARADLVYLAQPIGRILDLLPQIGELARPGTLVTDAGSTKSEIVSLAGRSIRRTQFLGGHPMAGKEARGVEAADSSLFEGRTYILTPRDPSEMDTPAANEFAEWLARIGARALYTSPERHDELVALTSHLPQLAATGLAALLGERLNNADDRMAVGPGLVDTTRLALSSYEIWRDILATNHKRIDAALAAYIEALNSLRSGLDTGDLESAFRAGALFREQIR